MCWGLNSHTIAQLRHVLARHGQVEKAILYGSRAKGTHNQGSDIDLALVGRDLDIHKINAIDNDLDDLLLPYSIDLCSYLGIRSMDLLAHIERVGVVFYDSAAPTNRR